MDNPDSIALIVSFYNTGKPVATVCHSPAVFHRVMYQGAPLFKGKRVTGFTNEEEEEVKLTTVVSFLVEDEFKRVGGLFEKVPNWQPFAIIDGRVITGQNPASSTAAAMALMQVLSADESDHRQPADPDHPSNTKLPRRHLRQSAAQERWTFGRRHRRQRLPSSKQRWINDSHIWNVCCPAPIR